MASSSTLRHFSTSIARRQGVSPPEGLQKMRPYLSNIVEREAAEPGRAAMIALAARTAPIETEGRRQIQQNKFLTPDELTKESLYASDSPRTRPPLLGPKTREARKIDPFHITRSSPLDHVFNPNMGQAFVNQVGWIKSRAETGLTWKSQRAAGKLVRRQRAMGIIGQWTGRPVAGGYGSTFSDYLP